MEIAIPAPHGPIPARIYTPKKLRKTNGLAPCLVFLHPWGARLARRRRTEARRPAADLSRHRLLGKTNEQQRFGILARIEHLHPPRSWCTARATFRSGRFEDINAQNWSSVIHINLTGSFLLRRAILPSMTGQRLGTNHLAQSTTALGAGAS